MKNWSLNAKFIGVLSIFVAANILIAVIGLQKMAKIKDSMNLIVHVLHERVSLVNKAKNEQKDLAITSRDLMLEQDPARMKADVEQMSQHKASIDQEMEEFNKIASVEGKKIAAQYQLHLTDWWETLQEISQLTLVHQEKEALVLSEGKAKDSRKAMAEAIDSIVELNDKRMKDSAQLADQEYEQARTQVLLASILALLAGSVLAFFILRAVNRAIDRVISNLDDNSAQVTTSAQQIAASSEELSQATSEQASSLEETSSSVEEINSMIQKSSENAKQSADTSRTSQENAVKGKKVVEQMIQAIKEISASNTDIVSQINESNRQISDIVQVISEIGNKTKVINDIVFQTKLLSFNASVEAARAGEHGKGFAVVAEEVGNLAQMSGNAAKEISSMLEGSIQKVERIVNESKSKVESLVQIGRTKVEAGTQVAEQCGDVLDEIVKSVSGVTGLVGEISTACQEQAQGVHEITKAMSQLDQVTQENAATSEETASVAEELSSQAESLRGVVKLLIQTIKGGDRGQPESNMVQAPRASTHFSGSTGANVIHLKNSHSQKVRVSSEVLKKAVGSESGVHNEDDSRFRDI